MNRWIRDRNLKPAGPIFRDITEPDPNKGSLSSKLIGGSAIALLVLTTGWIFREDLGLRNQGSTSQTVDSTEAPQPPQPDLPPLPAQPDSEAASNNNAGDRTADTTPETPPPAADALTSQPSTTPSAPPSEPSPSDSAPTDTASAANSPPNNTGATADAFAEAVRIANQAATDGQTATTSAEWLELAARWQRASDLMAQIPDSSEQYALAEERVQSYADNSRAALAEAAANQ